MRRVRSWSCWSCVGLLFLGFLGETTASHVGRPKRHHDTLHWVAKAQVTAQPLLRRDDAGASCPITAPVLCPASLSGGCCSSGYQCATDSCYATTAGPTTACGKVGFFACGAGDSGGCCPVGYLCGPTACAPPAGATETHTSCPFDYFLCPSSLNYGCCLTGMGCGLNQCYSTAPVTQTITEVFTSTAGDETITRTRVATTISTPTPPTEVPTKGFIPKFTPTAVPKSPQIPTKTNQGGGLTQAQLGGIVGGVVALLIIVLVATVLIIRHLKRVTDAVESSQKDPSGGSRTKTQSQAQMAYYGGHLHLTGGGDDNNRSVDPLMVAPNNGLPGSGTGTPQIGGGVRERSDSDALSPLQNGRGDSIDATGRHTSVDSPGYFDLPARPQNTPGGRQQMSPAVVRESADSHATGQYSQYAYHHWRQHSNASELSGDGSEALGSPIPELDSSGAYAELPGVDPGGNRSRSSSVASPRASFSHARKRSESNGQRPEPAAAAGFGPLDVVSESAEVMHGYYGPKDKQAGQTAAGLDVGWDISSPVAAARPLSQPMMLPAQTPSTPYTPDQQSPQPQQQQPQQEYQHQPPQQEYHQQPQAQQEYYQQPQAQQEYYQQPQVQAEPYQLYQQYQQQYGQQEQQPPQPQYYVQQEPGLQNSQNPQYPQQPQQPHYPPPAQ